jgi:hypothetical protein
MVNFIQPAGVLQHFEESEFPQDQAVVHAGLKIQQGPSSPTLLVRTSSGILR